MSVLYVAGEVDAAAAPGLRRHLAWACADPPGDVVVDLSRVTFMSCSGLRPLREAEGRLGERLWLRRVPRPVRRLLELTHLCSSFRVLEYRTTDDDESVEACRLEAQVAGVQEAVRGGAVIEQAKGLLMDVHDRDAEDAWHLLLRLAREGNVEVGDLAGTGTADADDGTLRVAAQAPLKQLLPAAQGVNDRPGR